MNLLDALRAAAGTWRGTSTLRDPHAGVADDSPSTAPVAPDPDGARLDYTWSYRGPAAARLDPVRHRQLGDHRALDRHLAHRQPADGLLRPELGRTDALRAGHPRRPPGPDWGWRIDVTPGGETPRVVTHNVWPQEQGGKEELAVEAVYARAERPGNGRLAWPPGFEAAPR
jgi:hypothetical protein